jgi:hypothetical protein
MSSIRKAVLAGPLYRIALQPGAGPGAASDDFSGLPV